MARKYTETLNETIFIAEDGKAYSRKTLNRSTLLNRTDEREINNVQSWGILKVLLLLLVLAMFISFVTGSVEIKTFRGFLQMLQNCPQFDFTSIFSFLEFDLGDWGAFDFIANFIEWQGDILRFLVWFCQVAVNALSFAFYFLKWLFLA